MNTFSHKILSAFNPNSSHKYISSIDDFMDEMSESHITVPPNSKKQSQTTKKPKINTKNLH